MAMLKLSSPWIIFYKEIQALFKYDRDVHVVFDEDKTKISLYVDNAEKADALQYLLPDTKQFGNVILKIEVVPANTARKLQLNMSTFTPKDLYFMAFGSNRALCDVVVVEGVFSNNLTYVIFSKEVVQYYDDNIGDFFGMKSTLFQDIAKDVFKQEEGVFFCTNVEEDFNGMSF